MVGSIDWRHPDWNRWIYNWITRRIADRKTLQWEKNLKIFKKCITNLRFVDTLLYEQQSALMPAVHFRSLNLKLFIVGTSWISDYLNSEKHHGNNLGCLSWLVYRSVFVRSSLGIHFKTPILISAAYWQKQATKPSDMQSSRLIVVVVMGWMLAVELGRVSTKFPSVSPHIV